MRLFLICLILFFGVAFAGINFLGLNVAVATTSQEPWRSMEHPEVAEAKEEFVPTLYDKAAETRASIRDGNFIQAKEIIDEILEASKVINWNYYPFSDYIKVAVPKDDELFLSQLEKWIEAEPANAILHMIKAEYYYNYGWKVRGGGFAEDVDDENFLVFNEYQNKAFEEATVAIELNPDIPYPYFQANMLALSVPEEIRISVFEKSIEKFSNYYDLYKARLRQLNPKWGGSYFEMLKFMKLHTSTASLDSPLNMLILDGYSDLTNNFDLYCKESYPSIPMDEARKFCNDKRKTLFESAEVKQELSKVFSLLNDDNTFEFNEYLAKNGNAKSFALYETAWPIIGDKSYGLNSAIGKYYEEPPYVADYLDDALRAYRKSLANAREFDFPDEASRNIRIAIIYQSMAEIVVDSIIRLKAEDAAKYESLRNLKIEDAINYAEVAYKLAPKIPTVTTTLCKSYFNAQQYKKALQYCEETLQVDSESYLANWYKDDILKNRL